MKPWYCNCAAIIKIFASSSYLPAKKENPSTQNIAIYNVSLKKNVFIRSDNLIREQTSTWVCCWVVSWVPLKRTESNCWNLAVTVSNGGQVAMSSAATAISKLLPRKMDFIPQLVGGWTTHLKNISQIGSYPQMGVKIKNTTYLNSKWWKTSCTSWCKEYGMRTALILLVQGWLNKTIKYKITSRFFC